MTHKTIHTTLRLETALAALLAATFAAVLSALLAAPAAAQNERIAVPLSNPDQPAWVQASIVQGTIRAEAYDGEEVLVEVLSQMNEVVSEEPREDGLRRIPNASTTLVVEEDDNRVHVKTRSWQRPAELLLKVPRRTSLKLKTVNSGDIEVRGIEGELELANTNGNVIALDVAGSVVAKTVNGELRVVLTSVTADAPMSFTNLNGDVDVTFPASIRADLRMRSDHGEILTDFDFEAGMSTRREEGAEGEGYRVEISKEVGGKLNGGGPEIYLKTFNGDVLIRRGD